MWYILLALGAIVAIGFREQRRQQDAVVTATVCIVCLVVLVPLAYPVYGLTGGFWPGYSEGARRVYVTKCSVKGLVFKTNECQGQVGTGALAAIQEPWDFSLPDPALFARAGAMLGQCATVRYEQWLVQPFREGGSGYRAVGIEPCGAAEATGP